MSRPLPKGTTARRVVGQITWHRSRAFKHWVSDGMRITRDPRYRHPWCLYVGISEERLVGRYRTMHDAMCSALGYRTRSGN